MTLPEEKSGEVILLSHSEPALKESLIDFAYLKGEGNRSFVLPIQHGRESSTINMSYVFYNSEGNIPKKRHTVFKNPKSLKSLGRKASIASLYGTDLRGFAFKYSHE